MAMVPELSKDVAQYLPKNFQVLGRTLDNSGTIIVGVDDHGWSLDAYVIPRLGSALIHCEEVVEINGLCITQLELNLTNARKAEEKYQKKEKKRGRTRALTDERVEEVRYAWSQNDMAWQWYRERFGQHSWARANQNALILAGLAAVGVNAQRPVIDIDLCRWAIELVTWSNNCWEAKISSTASGESYIEKDSFKIEAIINNPQKYAGQSGNSDHQRMALQNGFTPKAVLTRNTRGIDKKRREQILDDLHDAGLINSTEKFKQVVYFATPLSD